MGQVPRIVGFWLCEMSRAGSPRALRGQRRVWTALALGPLLGHSPLNTGEQEASLEVSFKKSQRDSALHMFSRDSWKTRCSFCRSMKEEKMPPLRRALFFFFKAFSMYQALSWVQCLLYLMLFSQQSCKVGTLLLLPLLYSWRN